ncbi:type VII secretion protein EccCb [Corynebacterium gerontici]|uniref:ESX-1 secretion system protein EccCa1 n=1 Tax=Corynebacterium gerontici TaxID=2079234 RepID=A0A3G6J285_9CORY|nr:type VII secretion protein EccCb [Corynebacterium gerontici]AZA12052.1 ESX-1 secretion system protein EccCa1 [Corynebacterium gerontici]
MGNTKLLAKKLFDAPPPAQHSTQTNWDVDEHHHSQPPELPTGELKAQPVPKAPKPEPVPLTRLLMPVIMVLVMGAMVAFMVLSGSKLNPMTMMFPLFMMVSMVAMFQPKAADEVNETRRGYLRHLMLLRDQAIGNAQRQREYETSLHPAGDSLTPLLEHGELWQRGSDEPLFSAVRIGLGRTPLCTPIKVEDPGASEELDPVCAIALRRVVRSVGTVASMPVVLQLQAFRAVTIVGEDAAAMLRSIVCQLAFHHRPGVIHVEVEASLRQDEQWQWTKWLPHTTSEGAFNVVLVDATRCPVEIARNTADERTVILAYFEGDLAGAEHNEMVAMAEDEGVVLRSQEQRVAVFSEVGEEDLGEADLLSVQGAAHFARQLAAFGQEQEIRQDERRPLQGMSPVVEEIERRWVARGKRRLAVPIGKRADGAALVLDLKESAHGGMGPHGLCVGATGSGKSELLRTLVVSLAAEHDPDTLNFVLVDFKGGATFLGLERLPHTSAVITNLAEEAVLVERMHDAIAGEMHRRQELLRSAGNFANVGEYLKARETRPDLEPMPALVIVLDEFSELLGQHPDFADLFVAVGRLGRSLHMHLLLASQRLEEGKLRGLDSHLSYRIGLKTFSSAESRQVLGVPDAYELPNNPGAGLLKTADGELVRFHTDYVSGSLMVASTQSQEGRRARAWFGWDEQALTLQKDPQGRTFLGATVDAAIEVAELRGQRARSIWLPPLPDAVPLAELEHSGAALHASIGLIDRPFEQRQDPLVLNFEGQRGHLAICGGPQSGKTTALKSTVLALAHTHSPDAARFYVLDLAGRDLASLVRLPHVSAVVHRDEAEKVARVVDEVTGLIDTPEQRHTFLIVDGWHVLRAEFEEHLEALNRIAADGLAARVHLIVSTPRWTALRPAVRDLIAQRLELKLGESLDSLIDRKAQERLPDSPGIGLSGEKELMRIACSSQQDIGHILQQHSNTTPVPALKLLPESITVTELQGEAPLKIGIGGARLQTVAWDADTQPHLLCLGGQASGKSTLLACLLQQIAALGPEQARIVLLDHRRSHLGTVPEDMLAGYAGSKQASQQLLRDALITLQQRLPGPDISPQALRARSWWDGPEIFLVIDDLDLIDAAVLQPLLEVMAHARDIGLHLVVARKIGGAMRALFQPFLSELKDQHPVVVMLSGERDDGPLFGVRPEPRIPGRGVLIERGAQQGMVQIAQAGQS